MDIILELVDTFIADHAYAHLFPIQPNKTGIAESWVWKPATKCFHFQPSQAAYMSSLARDNPYRQLFTLFFVTWQVFHSFIQIKMNFC